jgi:hypothetical protein
MDTMTTPPQTEDQQKQQPSPQRRITLPAVLGIAFLVMIGLVGFLGWRAIDSVGDAIPSAADVAEVFEPEPYVDIGPVVVTAIWDLGELTTVEMVEHTYIEKGTDGGWLSWARGDSLSMFVVAEVGAGVGLNRLTPSDFEVSDDGVVAVTLPNAEIHYIAMDNDSTVVIDRQMGLFTKGDPQLETEARQTAETILLDQAMEAGILERAETNATNVLSNFLISLGYTDAEISFED